MSITFYQGEADPAVSFTFTDIEGAAVDLTDATITMEVKRNLSDSSTVFTKADVDFDKTDEATGLIKVAFSSTDTNQTPTNYIGEITATVNSTNISKKQFTIIITKEI